VAERTVMTDERKLEEIYKNLRLADG
jgi:hypothetical protein